MLKFKYPHTQKEIDANLWQQATEEQAMDMLGCVPPAIRLQNAFAVGEPLCHSQGKEVYAVYVKVDGQWFCKPNTIENFSVDKMTKEIHDQIKEGQRIEDALRNSFEDIQDLIAKPRPMTIEEIAEQVGKPVEVVRARMLVVKEGKEEIAKEDVFGQLQAFMKKEIQYGSDSFLHSPVLVSLLQCTDLDALREEMDEISSTINRIEKKWLSITKE